MKKPPTHHAFAILSVLAVPFVVLTLHSINRFMPWYFLILVAAALVLMLGPRLRTPGLRLLSTLNGSELQAAWIVLICLAVIGYLHNRNVWTRESGSFHRAANTSLWKMEIILGISLAVPLLHWLIRTMRPEAGSFNGQLFAREFALYINFSGIAILLWAGDAIVSRSMLATFLAWATLAELTFYASG
jgi:hypothetical protein